MPREDRATWKSNYFLKIIVSAGMARGRHAAWALGTTRDRELSCVERLLGVSY